jgi:hypothetical protein
MKLIQRVAWYSGGFIVGIIVLMFFLSGKKTSCDYGMDARTLKDIRAKKLVIDSDARAKLSAHNLDSTAIIEVLKKGDVNFSNVDRSLDSCKVYEIEGRSNGLDLKFSVENCNTKANVQNISIISDD